MDGSETYMNVKFTKTHSRSPSRDGLNSTYSELNFRKEEPRLDQDDDPAISSGPGGLLTTAQTGAQQQEPKQNIRSKSRRKICLLCLVTFAVIAIVAGLSIHVSQTRQSLITSERNSRRLWEQHQEMNRTQRQCQQQVHELNSTLESRTSENSRLDFSQRICLNNLSAINKNLTILENNISVLNSDLLELNRTHSDLRHQFNQLEMTYRNITETKAQICKYLTRRRVPVCSQDWIENEGRCYFLSTFEKSYDGAREYCSNFDARLLEINSNQEEDFVSTSIGKVYKTYWIGKCRFGNVDSNLLYKSYNRSSCSKCNAYCSNNCKNKYRFICEKSDIPVEIRGLCQHPVGKS